jgi:hypothetical protein
MTSGLNLACPVHDAPAHDLSTFYRFVRWQREDGLISYKITESGPVFRQIQRVTPPARSVWHHAGASIVTSGCFFYGQRQARLAALPDMMLEKIGKCLPKRPEPAERIPAIFVHTREVIGS